MCEVFNYNSEQFYMICGFVSAMLSSGVRLMRDKSNFSSMYAVTKSVVDAFTCALLSYGVFLLLKSYLNVETSSIIFIGTFVGSLGSSTIIGFASNFLKNYIEKNDPK